MGLVFAISPVLAEDCQETSTYIGDVCDQSTAAQGSKVGPYSGTMGLRITTTISVAKCMCCIDCRWAPYTQRHRCTDDIIIQMNVPNGSKLYWWAGHYITGSIYLNESIEGQCISQEGMGGQPYISYQGVTPPTAPAPTQPDLCAE
jgi:hypothetical protein